MFYFLNSKIVVVSYIHLEERVKKKSMYLYVKIISNKPK